MNEIVKFDSGKELEIINLAKRGFAPTKIAVMLALKLLDVRNLFKEKDLKPEKRKFTESEIDVICQEYENGVSEKILSQIYNIDKRKVNKWLIERNIRRDKEDAAKSIKFNTKYFDEIDCEEKAYWMGVIGSWGYVAKDGYKLQISFFPIDKDILDKFSLAIGAETNIVKEFNDYGENKYKISISSKHMTEALLHHGIHYSNSFTSPIWIKDEYMKSWIRGLMDGHGGVKYLKEQNIWKWWITSHENCCELVSFYLKKELDISLNLSKISHSQRLKTTSDLISENTDITKNIMNWIYSNVTELICLDQNFETYKRLLTNSPKESYQLIKQGIGKEEFIRRAHKIYGEIYNYSKFEYLGMHVKSTIICGEHGEFLKAPHEHLEEGEQGCPTCIKLNPTPRIRKPGSNFKGTSKIEERVFKLLCHLFGESDIERWVVVNNWSIDLYIISVDSYIQVDGRYFHGKDRPLETIKLFKNPTDVNIYKTYLRDIEQNKWFAENGKTLVRVTDWEAHDIIDFAIENGYVEKVIEPVLVENQITV